MRVEALFSIPWCSRHAHGGRFLIQVAVPCCTHGVHEETSFTGCRQGPGIVARHAGVDTPFSGKAGEHTHLPTAFSGLWRCET